MILWLIFQVLHAQTFLYSQEILDQPQKWQNMFLDVLGESLTQPRAMVFFFSQRVNGDIKAGSWNGVMPRTAI